MALLPYSFETSVRAILLTVESPASQTWLLLAHAPRTQAMLLVASNSSHANNDCRLLCPANNDRMAMAARSMA
jgi:hypothetical protein